MKIINIIVLMLMFAISAAYANEKDVKKVINIEEQLTEHDVKVLLDVLDKVNAWHYTSEEVEAFHYHIVNRIFELKTNCVEYTK